MNGILLIDKPAGITSFGAVSRLRRILGMKKIGHAGTLDPMATGVLPILLGSSTRFLDYLPNEDKHYTALVKLGVETDTLDTTGEVTQTHSVEVSREDILNVINTFVGEIEQIPPMYSAVQKDGVRLYDLARKGIEVERTPRKITIYSANMLDFDEENNEFTLDVACSKGTYIRTLAADIGEKLGCGASLAGLNRTMAAGFKLSACYTLEEVEEYTVQNHIEKRIIPIEDALDYYPAIFVSEKQAQRFSNGGELDLIRLKGKRPDGLYRIFDPKDNFLGLGRANNSVGVLKAEKIFVK